MTGAPLDRLSWLQRRMRDEGVGLSVIGPTSHLLWLTGLQPHGDERPVMLLVGPTKAGMLIPALNAASQRSATSLPFYVWSDGDAPTEALKALIAETVEPGARRVTALDDLMRTSFALLMASAIPGFDQVSLAPLMAPLRQRKDPVDVAGLKASAVINDQAMQTALNALRPGISEIEVCDLAAAAFRAIGADVLSASVCFGENAAFPHHSSGSRVLRPNDTILIDLCGRYGSYPSDMTRVAKIGAAPAEFDEVALVVEQALMAALQSAKPGVTAATVDRAARSVIERSGFGHAFVHRTGHGIGLDIHEPPSIAAGVDTILEEGMVFSIEPGIYIDGRFGVRLEEVVHVGAGGTTILSELSRSIVSVQNDVWSS